MSSIVFCATGSDKTWQLRTLCRSSLDVISDVAKPCAFYQSDPSSAKIDYERPGAVLWSLVSYEANWQQVNQVLDERTVFVSLL